MRLLRQNVDRINVRELVELIRQDPALSAHVLSLANSPYMGTLRKITSVNQAVTLVGLEEIIGDPQLPSVAPDAAPGAPQRAFLARRLLASLLALCHGRPHARSTPSACALHAG